MTRGRFPSVQHSEKEPTRLLKFTPYPGSLLEETEPGRDAGGSASMGSPGLASSNALPSTGPIDSCSTLSSATKYAPVTMNPCTNPATES